MPITLLTKNYDLLRLCVPQQLSAKQVVEHLKAEGHIDSLAHCEMHYSGEHCCLHENHVHVGVKILETKE